MRSMKYANMLIVLLSLGIVATLFDTNGAVALTGLPYAKNDSKMCHPVPVQDRETA